MRLDPHDLSLFYTLYKALMFFVNQRLDVIEKPLASPDRSASCPRKSGSSSVTPWWRTWT